MGSLGKDMRLRRLFRPETKRCILFAVSHGTSTPTIFPELQDTSARVSAALAGGVDSVLISRGFAEETKAVFSRHPEKGFVVKVSATAYEDNPCETVIASVDGALRAGADAIGILMQLTPSSEAAVLGAVAQLGEECERQQLPFLVEAELPSAYGKRRWAPEDPVVYLRRSCRLAQELGADVIKTNWTGDAGSFRAVLDVVSQPVLVAGGSQVEEREFLAMIEDALGVGAAGCSVGRNIFQAPNPQEISEKVAAVVHQEVAVAV